MSSGGDETSTIWSLDLDTDEAMEKVEKFHGALDSIGEVESIEALIGTMKSAGLAAAGLGAAIFAIKESIDLVFDAEKIRMVENQFELLSEKAGIAGEALKKSMLEASAGLLSEDEVLKSANRGLVELGTNAAQMGQVMQLARQATLVMGGDLKTNFDSIVQGIASGSTRALRSMGIIIDQKKAFKDYAASIGVAASELSKMGQQHAIMNAVLEKGGEAFKGVNPNIAEATNAWASFKSTMKDVGDIATLAFEKIAGKAVRAQVSGLSAIAKDAKRYFVDMFGGGAEQAEAHTERLKEKIQQLKGSIIDLEQKKLGHVLDPAPGDTAAKFQAFTKMLKQYEGELEKTEGVKRKLASETEKKESDGEKATTTNKEVNLELRAKNQLKYEMQLDAMRSKTLSEEKRQATSIAQIDKINLEQKKLIMNEELNEKKKIDQQEGLSTKQRDALKVQLEQQTRLKIHAIDKADEADKTAALKNFEEENKNSAAGFAAAWSNAGHQASLDMMSFAKLGETSINAVQGSFTNAFKAIGDGSKSAGEAMKDALLQALGQIAISEGSMLLLAGIGELNPAKAAAGGALISLGSYLESQGGGGAGAPPISAGGGATSSAGSSSSASTVGSPSNLQQAPSKTVSLTITGNYYESNETKTQLMDMIRQSTDATDFNYNKVGGK